MNTDIMVIHTKTAKISWNSGTTAKSPDNNIHRTRRTSPTMAVINTAFRKCGKRFLRESFNSVVLC
jgi:hypothetical protein